MALTALQVEYSWGATEVKASLPGVGGIVDITETGSSLKANKLRVSLIRVGLCVWGPVAASLWMGSDAWG